MLTVPHDQVHETKSMKGVVERKQRDKSRNGLPLAMSKHSVSAS